MSIETTIEKLKEDITERLNGLNKNKLLNKMLDIKDFNFSTKDNLIEIDANVELTLSVDEELYSPTRAFIPLQETNAAMDFNWSWLVDRERISSKNSLKFPAHDEDEDNETVIGFRTRHTVNGNVFESNYTFSLHSELNPNSNYEMNNFLVMLDKVIYFFRNIKPFKINTTYKDEGPDSNLEINFEKLSFLTYPDINEVIGTYHQLQDKVTDDKHHVYITPEKIKIVNSDDYFKSIANNIDRSNFRVN